jgi:hypothetical protein
VGVECPPVSCSAIESGSRTAGRGEERKEHVRSTIFEPIKPLTAVLLQQIDVLLGASPNWLGLRYRPSPGTACSGQVDRRPIAELGS